MKTKRWTAILLSAILALSVCMPVNGISAYAAEEAAAETVQDASEELDSVGAAGAAVSGEESLAEEESVEESPAMEEDSEDADDVSAGGSEAQESADGFSEDPADYGLEDEPALPVEEELSVDSAEGEVQESADSEETKVSEPKADAGWLNVYPAGAGEGVSSRTITRDAGDYAYLSIIDSTDGSSPIHYAWYDENDQILDGSEDASWFEMEEVWNSCTVRCHAEDENGNSADLMFYIKINSYLVVYPEGGYEWDPYAYIDILGKDSVTLRTIAENSTGSSLTYQWQKQSYDQDAGVWEDEWTDLDGAAQDIYTVEAPMCTDRFCCRVTDEEENSGEAYFYLYAETYLDAMTDEDSWTTTAVYDVREMDEVTFRPWAASEDPGRITWQWAKLDGDTERILDGENGDEYTVLSPRNGDTYICIVGDGYGYVTRLYYYFRQNNHLYVTADEEGNNPVELDPRSAENFTLTPCVDADDTSMLTYSWSMSTPDGEEQEGIGDGSSLFIDHHPEHGTEYRCKVSDQYGNSGTASYGFRVDTRLRVGPKGKENGSEIRCVVGGLDSITLTAVAEAEEGAALSWQWYRNDESIDGESGSIESPAAAFEISLDVDGPQAGDEYYVRVKDAFGNSRTVWFYFVEEAAALNVYPRSAEEGEDTAVVSYNSDTDELWLAVYASYPTDLDELSFDWRDPEGNPLGSPLGYTEDNEAYLYDFTDGAKYSCTVTDAYGQTATVWFVLHYERQEGDPTEEDFANASDISVGDSVDVEVTDEAPVVWFRFTPGSEGTYELYSTGDSVDTYATLYAQGGNTLASNDDGAGNGQFSISHSFEEGKAYYFGVRTYSRNAGSFTIHLVSGEKDEWLNAYNYRIEGDQIVLTGYYGEDVDVTVPGHAMARGREYSRIVLSSGMWPSGITSLSFEEGVAFPDRSDYLFDYLTNLVSIDLHNVDMANVTSMYNLFMGCINLASIDLGGFDFSKVDNCKGLFSGCISLQTIEAPLGLQTEAPLPKTYYDAGGNAYSALPLGLQESITLTKMEESEWLSSYDYGIENDAIVLKSYYGNEQEIVVPGSAQVDGKTYSKVRFNYNLWPNGLTSITFEKGVAFPASCRYFFENRSSLETVNMSKIDASAIEDGYHMFNGCGSLTTIYAPAGLAAEIEIPDAFVGDDGGLYSSLPVNLSESMKLEKAKASEWLKEYDFAVSGDTIILKAYHRIWDPGDDDDDWDDDDRDDDEDDFFEDDLANSLAAGSDSANGLLEVPGSAEIGGKEFHSILLANGLWNNDGSWILELSLDDGIILPENCDGMFSGLYSLERIDLSRADASRVSSADKMFGSGNNLQRIISPAGLKADAVLPVAFKDGEGNIYSTLPKNQTKSLTLTRALVSDELSDYNYEIIGDRIKLLSYRGDSEDIVVPGMVTVEGREFHVVELTPGMWNNYWDIRSLAFEEGVVLPQDCRRLFSNLYNVTSIDLSGLDWSGVTNMEELFSWCENLTNLDLSGMETGNVTNMSGMFSGCWKLAALDVRGFDTGNVTDMSAMFSSCDSLTSLDLSGFNTQNVTDMAAMFSSCDNLAVINTDGWNTGNVTDMNSMFYFCENLTALDIHGWDTGSVTNMCEMFCGCYSLAELSVSGLDTSKVTDMSYMFSNCRSLTELDLSGFRTESLIDVRYMFRNCSALTTVNLGDFDASAVKYTKRMFEGCGKLARIYAPKNLTKTISLPAIYDGSDGGRYGTLPRYREESVVLLYARNFEPGESGDPAPDYALEDAVAEITLSQTEFTYSGTAYKPDVKVVYNGTELTPGTNYTVSYRDNTEAGEATVTIVGIGSYGGIVQKTFTIHRADLTDPQFAVTVDDEGYVYNGSGIRPSVTVTDGTRTLAAETDYTTEYADNINAGTAALTVTGAGNYKGTVTKTFIIAKAAQSITLKAKASAVSVGKTTTVSTSGARGAVAYKSSNTKLATVTSAGKVTAKKVGTVKITATAAETANYRAASKTVTIKVVPAATKTLKAANLAKGIKLSWAKVTDANGYVIYRNNKKVKTITKGATVTWSDTKANTNGTKYVYKVFAKASTGISKLSKSVTTYCVARPDISPVSNSASKAMTVKWGKNAKATGYVIQYGLKKNFSGAKTASVSKAATVSKVISGLKKGKTYYVRIKAYKKVGKVKYESAWSPAKTVKITQ